MSTTEIRNNTTDDYTVLTQYGTTNQATEVAIVQALVQSAYDKTTIDVGSSTYVSPANDSSWNIFQVNNDNIDKSAISNYPSGTLTEYSVLSSVLVNDDVSFNTYSTNISSSACANNTYSFSNLSSSAPYYDCNYVITQSLIADCSDNSGNFVTGTFDLSNANVNIQYAMQSRWNTTLGPYDGLNTVGQDPTALQQSLDFNINDSFAKYGSGATDASYESYWWDASSNGDGSLAPHLIDASNQPVVNHLLIGNRDMSNVTLTVDNDVGIFRIQKAENTIVTQVKLNDASFVNITPTDLDYMPLFNGYDVSTTDMSAAQYPVPGNMNIEDFKTLVNTDVYNTIADGWTFTVDISANNGGYDISGNHPLMSNLDNSNILDNPYYMANYVSNPHSISFSDATVTVDPSTNGVLNDASNILVDLTAGETLSATYAGVNGQIIINTHTINTRCTDVSGTDFSGASTQVIYNEDVSATYPTSLSSAEMNAQTFNGMWQKVAQKSDTTDPSYYIEKNNSAIMTLYTNEIVNSSYDTTDFAFSFNNTLFGSSTDIQLWKLISTNTIVVNPESLYADPNYTQLQDSFATSGIISGLTDNLTYNNYRILLTAKVKEDLGLYNVVEDSPGWELHYGTNTDTWLTTSSDNAFSKVVIPYYNIVDPVVGATIAYSYTYGTVQDSSGIGGLVDYVDVSYTYLGQNYTFQIPQNVITRVYDPSFNDGSYNVIDSSTYSFTGPYNKTSWELVQLVTYRKYDASFPASHGPFNNLILKVKEINQTDTRYAIRNKTTGQWAPHFALKYVVSSIVDLKIITEVINANPGHTLNISGTMGINDIKPFRSVAQASNDNISWSNIGEIIYADTYYGIDNTSNIYDPSGILTFNIEFANPNSPDYLLNQYYYMPFIYSAENNTYTLQNFTASTANIGDINNTDIGATSYLDNLNYLTLTNAYNNVINWTEDMYNVSVVTIGSTTTFTVTDIEDNTVFTIAYLNNTIFLGSVYVSYIPQDYYRVENVLDGSFNEGFIITNYENNVVDLSNVLQGLYINNGVDPLTDTSCPALGVYQSFRVLGDYMSINEVGTTYSPTLDEELGTAYNSGSLVFQYVDASNYSAIFTFPKYRGYYSYTLANPDEYYTIVRDSTVVTFDVAGTSPISQTLTSNMYIGQTFVVDNLMDNSANLIANLNISGSFYYSIPPTGYTLSYGVNVTGDSVAVNFINPNYHGDASNILVPAGATPVVNPKLYGPMTMSLKDFGQNNMYTFSGLWYSTNNLMGIRPSRVKLYNSNYTYNKLSYRIQFGVPVTAVYKARVGTANTWNWIGNPHLKGGQNPNITPVPTVWVLHNSYTVEQMYTGFYIGTKHIYLDPNYIPTISISYIVSTPPYYAFEQISTENCPVIPYNYDASYNSNRLTRYIPYIKNIGTDASLNKVFSPFAPLTIYTDINYINANITTSTAYINNIRFTISSTPSMTNALLNPDTTRHGLIVPGTNIRVSLYLGDYNSTNAGSHTNPIWNAPITSIPSTPNISNNALLLRQRTTNGNILFSALQYPVDIGYPSGLAGYQEIFGTDLSGNYYNIDFNMGNTAWFNNNSPITYFNCKARGIKPTLYTVTDINYPLTQLNKRRIYKYITNTTINIDASNSSANGYQTFNLIFSLGRSYCDFDIQMNNTFPTSGMWQYNNLLNATVIDPSSINWVVDASYSDITYVSWAFGNSNTSTQMLTGIFSVQDNEQKWVYIQLEPFMRYLNQFYMQVGSIAWDGSVTAPLVNTRIVRIAPQIQNPYLINNTYTTQEYSESTI